MYTPGRVGIERSRSWNRVEGGARIAILILAQESLAKVRHHHLCYHDPERAASTFGALKGVMQTTFNLSGLLSLIEHAPSFVRLRAALDAPRVRLTIGVSDVAKAVAIAAAVR